MSPWPAGGRRGAASRHRPRAACSRRSPPQPRPGACRRTCGTVARRLPGGECARHGGQAGTAAAVTASGTRGVVRIGGEGACSVVRGPWRSGVRGRASRQRRAACGRRAMDRQRSRASGPPPPGRAAPRPAHALRNRWVFEFHPAFPRLGRVFPMARRATVSCDRDWTVASHGGRSPEASLECSEGRLRMRWRPALAGGGRRNSVPARAERRSECRGYTGSGRVRLFGNLLKDQLAEAHCSERWRTEAH